MSGKKRAKQRLVDTPYQVVNIDYFAKLSPHANKPLIDMSLQRNGRNNGALSARWTLMAKRGWKSRSTLHRAVTELIGGGFIVVTRRGMKIRGRPTLYALIWDGMVQTAAIFALMLASQRTIYLCHIGAENRELGAISQYGWYKKKDMHQKTFDRLQAQYCELNGEVDRSINNRLGKYVAF